ncbi:hypothetical protein [Methylobacterium fujisawaense]|uniref:hypothetical protein n=1 Tax=Methylobacterium fujisawaense TaxID=107400 RepID=UPI002F358453
MAAPDADADAGGLTKKRPKATEAERKRRGVGKIHPRTLRTVPEFMLRRHPNDLSARR